MSILISMKKIIFMIICAALTCGCGKKAEGPEVVVEAFYKAVTAGDWDGAAKFWCSSEANDYIDALKNAWESLQTEDENALNMAAAVLSDVKVNIEKTEKTDQGKAIYYTLEVGEFCKRRKACVRKEEREWRVMEIIDAI